LYADYLVGLIGALELADGNRLGSEQPFAQALDGPVDLSQGSCGEIFVAELPRGRVLRITPPGWRGEGSCEAAE
jgi:hypothetical protein